jgi:hypothetical protein
LQSPTEEVFSIRLNNPSKVAHDKSGSQLGNDRGRRPVDGMAINQMQGYPIGNSRVRLSWARTIKRTSHHLADDLFLGDSTELGSVAADPDVLASYGYFHGQRNLFVSGSRIILLGEWSAMPIRISIAWSVSLDLRMGGGLSPATALRVSMLCPLSARWSADCVQRSVTAGSSAHCGYLPHAARLPTIRRRKRFVSTSQLSIFSPFFIKKGHGTEARDRTYHCSDGDQNDAGTATKPAISSELHVLTAPTLADRYHDGDRRRYCTTATKPTMLHPLLQWAGWPSIDADIATKSTVRSGIRLCHRAQKSIQWRPTRI